MDKDEKIFVKTIRSYLAYKDFLDTSPKVQKNKDLKFPRLYHQHDFDKDQKEQSTRYGIYRMGAVRNADDKIHKIKAITDDATVKKNCFDYSLAGCTGDYQELVVNAPPFASLKTIYDSVTKAVPKVDAISGDILAYTNADGIIFHSSVYIADADGKNPGLRYRFRASPIFELRYANHPDVTKLDTPMYYTPGGPTSAPGTWGWSPKGSGDSAQLYAQGPKVGPVCRPLPKE